MARICSFCVLLIALQVAPVRASTGPRLIVRHDAADSQRVCSPHFSVRVTLVNGGDEPLLITRVRRSCPSCFVSRISQDRIEPGESAEFSMSGRRPREGAFEISAYIESNDEESPITQVRLDLEYRRAYAVDLSWEGREPTVHYPYESSLRLEQPPLGRPATLTAVVTSLTDQTIKDVAVLSDHFKATQVSSHGGTAEVTLASDLEGPGVYHDTLSLRINGTDMVTVPLRVVIYADYRVVEPMVCFSYVAEGSVVEATVRMEFAPGAAVWREFKVEAPEGMDRAVVVEDIAREGSRVDIKLRVDTKFLGGKGLRWVPLCVRGREDDEVAFVSLYGHVY